MPFVVVAAQYLLAVVFAVSAIAKIRDSQAFRRYVAALRLPVRLSTVATVAGELVVAVLLLVPATAPVGFGLALVMLGFFSLALGRGRRLDVQVPCGCFGRSSGRGGLARNGVLAVVAAAGLAGSVATAPVPLSSGSVATSALGVAAAIVLVRFDDLRKGLR
jgi:hypothetical protein